MRKVLTANGYKSIKLLGKGQYGVVLKAAKARIQDPGTTSRRPTYDIQNPIALKVIKIREKDTVESVMAEVDMLSKLSIPKCNPFISCYYGSKEGSGYIFIEMELVDGIDLDEYMKNLRPNSNESRMLARIVAIGISTALIHVHSVGILHRDIKPANIMMTKGSVKLSEGDKGKGGEGGKGEGEGIKPTNRWDYGVPKLIDFGLGCTVEDSDTKECQVVKQPCCKGTAGTPLYQAPEVLYNSTNIDKSDIWSLGVTLYQVATGEFVWDEINGRDIESVDRLKQVIMTDSSKVPTIPGDDKVLATVIKTCINTNPDIRLSARQLYHVLTDTPGQ
jgi:serine/threonine-protein kinase